MWQTQASEMEDSVHILISCTIIAPTSIPVPLKLQTMSSPTDTAPKVSQTVRDTKIQAHNDLTEIRRELLSAKAAVTAASNAIAEANKAIATSVPAAEDQRDARVKYLTIKSAVTAASNAIAEANNAIATSIRAVEDQRDSHMKYLQDDDEEHERTREKLPWRIGGTEEDGYHNGYWRDT